MRAPSESVILLLLAAAGLPSVLDAQRPKVRDSAGIRIVENFEPRWERPWRIVDPPELRLGGDPEDRVRWFERVVGVVRLSDGALVVAEASLSELRWFGSGGRHLRTTRGRDGPEALVLLAGMIPLGGDSLLVLDRRFRRVSILDREGSFVSRTVLEAPREVAHPEPITRFLDGSYLVLPRDPRVGDSGPIRTERLPLKVFRYSVDGGVRGTLAALEGREVVIGPTGRWYPGDVEPVSRIPRPFGRTTAVVADRSRWIIGNNARYELEYRTPEGETTLLVRRSVRPRVVTEEHVETDRGIRLRPYGHPVIRRRVSEAMDRWPPPPRTMPAFGSEMRADREGGVWVREYAPPGEERNDWSVFDAEGRWLGVLALPPGEAVAAIDGDRLLTVRDTESKGQIISLYRIDKA